VLYTQTHLVERRFGGESHSFWCLRSGSDRWELRKRGIKIKLRTSRSESWLYSWERRVSSHSGAATRNAMATRTTFVEFEHSINRRSRLNSVMRWEIRPKTHGSSKLLPSAATGSSHPLTLLVVPMLATLRHLSHEDTHILAQAYPCLVRYGASDHSHLTSCSAPACPTKRQSPALHRITSDGRRRRDS